MEWKSFRSHLGYLAADDIALIEKAFELGKTVHRDQKRKSGQPFFMHPIAVAVKLTEMSADRDTVIAALLHDSIEDSNVSLSEIELAFNPSVVSLIDGVTKLSPEDFKHHPDLDENIETLRKLFTYLERDVRIIVIKLVDRLHNMQTIEYLSPERQLTFAQETRDVYVKLADRLCLRDLRDELLDLSLEVLEPDVLGELHRRNEENTRQGAKAKKSMREKMSKESHFRDVEIEFESKTLETLRQEWRMAKGYNVSHVKLAIICRDIDQCYAIFGWLHQQWKREVFSFEDFINDPRNNGYQGLHTTVILEDGMRVRCKIRTNKMHEYARHGIALYCFDLKEDGVLSYLPWMRHIQALSDDTKRRSDEFWQNLQSDLLGKVIVVHTGGDRPIALPEGSTALDGAMYCFEDTALRLSRIIVNGVEVEFHTPLQHADSLSIEFGNRKTVNRSWLSHVNTGFAQAKIRSELSKKSDLERLIVGRKILQDEMQKEAKGYLEEFESSVLQQKIEQMGYSSLDDVFRDIADGYLEPRNILDVLFQKGVKNDAVERPHLFKIIFSLPEKSAASMENILRFFDRYKFAIHSIILKKVSPRKKASVLLSVSLTKKQEEKFMEQARSMGLEKTREYPVKDEWKYLLLSCFVFVLWGLDPVGAYYLIQSYGITTVDFTLIRFWSMAVVFFAVNLVSSAGEKPTKKVSFFDPLLWLSAVLLVGVSVSTYAALQSTLPSQYQLILVIAGLIATTVTSTVSRNRLIFSWLCLLTGTAVLIGLSPEWTDLGLFYTVLALLSFTAFLFLTEYHKRKQHILVRSLHYYSRMLFSCVAISSPLIFVSSVSEMSTRAIVYTALFCVFLLGIPYYLYYYLLSHNKAHFVFPYSFIVVISVVVAQWLTIDRIGLPTLIAAAFAIAGAVQFLLWKQQE